MRKKVSIAVLVAIVSSLLCAQQAPQWKVRPEWVRAHEEFLASDALRGRGSATPDELVAATYVASQFENYGLKPPGGAGFIQRGQLESIELDGHAQLEAKGISLGEGNGFYLLRTSGDDAEGPLQKISLGDTKSAKLTPGAIILLSGTSPDNSAVHSALGLLAVGAKAVLMEDSPSLQNFFSRWYQGKTRVPIRLKSAEPSRPSGGSIVVLDNKSFARFQRIAEGSTIHLLVHSAPTERDTYNAIGILPGSDPHAGALLLTAHLDHLGIGMPVDGDSIYNGADDDASGTTAVLELAHALAAGPQLRRTIVFVCFGSEEFGDLGSEYFREHPPLPLDQIIANLEFEMIGAPDSRLPKDTLLLTGWERSNLGPALNQHGAHLAPDPYPELDLFERSDNYALALKGVVAHTAGGSPVVPWYHRPNDDLSHLDFDFLTTVIQSLVEPLRWLANSDFKPQWNAGGQPH